MSEAGKKADSLDKFGIAHRFTAKWEGGISDHPADRGGYTAFGVSTRFMRELLEESPSRRFLATLGFSGRVDRELMRRVDKEKAASIFRYYFWDANALDDFYLPIGVCWYDMAVNHGRAGSARMLQQACNNVLKSGLKVDGVAGPLTRRAALRGDIALADEMLRIRRSYFQNIVFRNSSQRVFLKGWLNRANDLESYIHQLKV